MTPHIPPEIPARRSSVSLPRPLWDRLERLAKKHSRTRDDVMRYALEWWVERVEKDYRKMGGGRG